tara:strand:+ start:4512 stop:6776 length:2265 start_codon:yes stop_codon:yes gene_type:complete
MSDFHKQWKNYVSLVEQAPPLGPPGSRPRDKSPVRVPVGYDSTKPTSRKTRKLERGITITFPDPDGPQSGSGKRMVTRTLYRIPGDEGYGADWKSWDPNDEAQVKQMKRDLMIHAKTLEGRLNNPEFMKIMRETHPEESQDFAGLQNMMIGRPYEFELRLNAIQATKDAGPVQPNLPPGTTAAPEGAKPPPNFANMEASKQGAIEFGKQYDVSEQELQTIWDEEEAKLKTAYDNKDLEHAGAIKVHGEYYDNQGNVNQKARQYLTNKTAKEFQKRMMKVTHPKWSEEQITNLVDTGEDPEVRPDREHTDAVLKRIAKDGGTDMIEFGELLGSGKPTSVASYWVEKALEAAKDVPEEDRKFATDDWSFLPLGSDPDPDLWLQSITGEPAKHGFPGIPATMHDAASQFVTPISNLAAHTPYIGSKADLPSGDEKKDLQRCVIMGDCTPEQEAKISTSVSEPWAGLTLPLGLVRQETWRPDEDVFGDAPREVWASDDRKYHAMPTSVAKDFQSDATAAAQEDYEQGIRYKHDPSAKTQTMKYQLADEDAAAEAQAAEQVRAAQKAQQAAAIIAAQRKAQGRSKTYRDYVPSALRWESIDHASNEMIVEHIKRAIIKEYYQGSESREGARMPINMFKQDRHITYDSDPFDVFSYEFEQAFNSLVAKYNFAIEDEYLHEPIFHEAGRVIQSFVDVDSIEREVPQQVYDEDTTLDVIMSEFQNLFAELVATHSAEIDEENLGDDVYREALGLVKARLGLV